MSYILTISLAEGNM